VLSITPFSDLWVDFKILVVVIPVVKVMGLKEIVIFTSKKKRVSLGAPIFYYGIDFKLLLQQYRLFKAIISKKL
jgi:hypothetical protein